MGKIILLASLLGIAFCISNPASAGKSQLQITVKAGDIDLENRTLYFRLNHPAEMAEIKVYDLEGSLLVEKMEMFEGSKAGKRHSITWPQLINDPDNFRIELKATDVNEFWVGFQVVRFFGQIPHEEVVFDSGKWDIKEDQAPKLDDVVDDIVNMVLKFQKYAGNMKYSLYVAGYTDTVGNLAANRELSRNRANGIARYLNRAVKAYAKSKKLKKVKISIFVRGFGEEVLAVPTKDNVPNASNRRADYIISNFPPAMPGPGAWSKMR